MDHTTLIDRLEHDAAAIVGLTTKVSEEQARWRREPDAWSLLEVLCHLRDEEREDFRARLEVTLERPEEPWPPIDPAGWVRERRYQSEDLASVVAEFTAERARSVAWLRGLGTAAWEKAYEHPKLGTLRAGDLLLSWVAHDCLHLRQLARLHYLYAGARAPEYRADYAGDW